jgi:AraC-like DNA-binding protein
MGRSPPNRSAAGSPRSAGRRSKDQRISPPDALGVATRLAAGRLRAAGIVLKPLLDRAGLSADQIDCKEVRIAVASQIIFLELAAKALQQPLLGFSLACECDLREMGLLHYAAGATATLGEALQRFERYSSIVNEGITLRSTVSGDLTIELGYAGVARHSDQQQMEFLITAIIRGCRSLTGRALKPTAVSMIHQSAREHSELEHYFGCRIAFGAEADRICFDRAARELRLVGADPYLDQILRHYCEQALAHRHWRSSSLRSAIENALTPLLPHGDIKFDAIAQGLGVSRRTLARRLKAEGLSFSEILKQLRSDLIARYLQEDDLSISQVAWLVGFQSVAAFSHSCKRWSGMSPKAWRNALLKC